MDFEEASHLVADVDARDHRDRTERLVDLVELLGDDVVGFSGQAAEWLFEDVKATWLYGYFTATVLTSYAFCVHQLAGLVRMALDDPSIPETDGSLGTRGSLRAARADRPRGAREVDRPARQRPRVSLGESSRVRRKDRTTRDRDGALYRRARSSGGCAGSPRVQRRCTPSEIVMRLSPVGGT